jgi:hypothetical protein
VPAHRLASVEAYLDWDRFGVLPMPLWEMPADVAAELRILTDTLGLPGPWLNGFKKSR